MPTDLEYYRGIFKRIERDEPRPVYLLMGEELLIMEELATRIVERNAPEELRGFNLTVEHGGEIDIGGFISTARSYPFMSGRRVVLIKELERLRGAWKPLIEYCHRPVESTVAVFLSNTHDEQGRKIRQPRDFASFEKAVSSNGEVVLCSRLSDAAVLKWISSSARKMGIQVSKDAANALLASVGPNLFDLRNEIEKLAVVFSGERICAAEIADILGRYRVNAVHDLIASIRPGDEARTLRILSGIISTGAERPTVVVYHLIRYFLALLRERTEQGAGGYRFRKLIKDAGNVPIRAIIVWLENLRIVEVLMKSTAIPEDILLDAAVLHSMKGKPLDSLAATIGAA